MDSILGSPIYLEYQILVSGPEFLVSEKIDFKFNIMFKDIFQNYYDFLVLKPHSSRFTNTAEYFRGHTNVHLKLFSCHYFTLYSWRYKLKPAGIYPFKVNNRNTRARCEICSNLTIKTPERRHLRNSGVLLQTLNLFHTLF